MVAALAVAAGDPGGAPAAMDASRSGDDSAFQRPSSWAVYDAGQTCGLSTKGYFGAVFDGRYVQFALYSSGVGRFHGRVLRYDTQATAVPR